MSAPFEGWYHCIASTYGTWVRGDARGFRTRHHREHVEGDYRSPPPRAVYQHLDRQSKRLLRTSPIVLSPAQRKLVCEAMGTRLTDLGVQVLEISVGPTHVHALLRFPNFSEPNATIPGMRRGNMLEDGRDPVPRHLLGMAKKHTSHCLRQRNLKEAGTPLWGRRSKLIPIEDHPHQLAVLAYIRRHDSQDATLWTTLLV